MIMALVENAGVDLGINNVASSRKFDSAPKPDSHPRSDLDQPEQNHLGFHMVDQSFQMKVQQYHQQQYQQQQMRESFTSMMHVPSQVQQNLEQGNTQSGYGGHGHARQRSNGGGADLQRNGEIGESFKQDIRDLEELLSKLNPMAEEFVPPSLTNHGSGGGHFTNNFVMHNNSGNTSRRVGSDWKNNYGQSKRRINNRTSMAQQDEIIRRTVYVSDIDHQVTEEQLAALFVKCGHVVDCRVCGDPNSVLRFAFVEFTDDEGAKNALTLAGTMLGYYPVRVLPSKTAIAPVNPTFLPKSEDEREMCARTIYCTNIDKKVSQADVKLFFESICGEVYRLRLLGDYQHSTRIAFVEFVMAESAIAALNCSGVVLGSLPIRVSPSKTPVRPRAPRPPMH